MATTLTHYPDFANLDDQTVAEIANDPCISLRVRGYAAGELRLRFQEAVAALVAQLVA